MITTEVAMNDVIDFIKNAIPQRAEVITKLMHESREYAGATKVLRDSVDMQILELRQLLTQDQQSQEHGVKDVFSELSNDTMRRAPGLLITAAEKSQNQIIIQAGINRFGWALSAGANGTKRGNKLVNRYIDLCSAWTASNYMIDLLDRVTGDDPMDTDNNYKYENIRRIFSTEIRFSWVSRLIVESTIKEVKSQYGRYSKMQHVNHESAEAYFRLCESAMTKKSKACFSSFEKQDAEVSNFMRYMSMEAGSLANLSFRDLMLSRTFEQKPFIRYSDAKTFPIGLREAVLHIEQPLLEMCRELVTEPKARSDLFENIISRCLQATTPNLMHAATPPLAVAVGSNNPGEIDFALLSKELIIIGEAKAKVVTNKSESSIHAFPDQVGEAVKQLRVRLEALENGNLLQTGLGGATTRTQKFAGIVVPLHSYAGAIFSKQALSEIDHMPINVSIITLHQLLMVTRSCEDVSDFISYLELRHNMIESNCIIQDEADILAVHLSPSRNFWKKSRATKTGRTQIITKGFKISIRSALKFASVPTSAEWRQFFWSALE